MNVGRSGVAKTAAILDLVKHCQIIVLQEVNINALSTPGVMEQWRKLGYSYFPGPEDPSCGEHRVAILCSLPSRAIGLDFDGDQSRICAIQCEIKTDSGYFKFCVASFYGQVNATSVSKECALNAVQAIRRFSLPWAALGDWNLTHDEMSYIFSHGLARCFDEDFQIVDMLPPTCIGTRRIDFGIGCGLWPTCTSQSAGVADHDCVQYELDVSYSVQCLAMHPRRQVSWDSEAEIHQLFLAQWCPERFQRLLLQNELDEAWTLLSNIAEECMCDEDSRCPPSSSPPSWYKKDLGHRRTITPESVSLRRLKRLHRRLVQWQKDPDVDGQADLLRKLEMNLHSLTRIFRELEHVHLSNLQLAIQKVEEVINDQTQHESDRRLQHWSCKINENQHFRNAWVKLREQAVQNQQCSMPKPGVPQRWNALHPAHVLAEACSNWTEVWTRKVVDHQPFLSMLTQVSRPDEGDFITAIHLQPTGIDLQRLAEKMLGKAPGPDSWKAEHLVRLPDLWWQGLADLWCAVLQSGRVPSAWKHATIVLLDKSEAGDTRPIGLSNLAWRLGVRHLVRALKPWLETWLAHTTLGGVFGSSVADAHAFINGDNDEDAIFISQDLSKCFDSIDYGLLGHLLQHLKMPRECANVIQFFLPGCLSCHDL